MPLACLNIRCAAGRPRPAGNIFAAGGKRETAPPRPGAASILIANLQQGPQPSTSSTSVPALGRGDIASGRNSSKRVGLEPPQKRGAQKRNFFDCPGRTTGQNRTGPNSDFSPHIPGPDIDSGLQIPDTDPSNRLKIAKKSTVRLRARVFLPPPPHPPVLPPPILSFP